MDHEQHPSQHARPLRRLASPLIVWVQLVKPGIVFGNLIAVIGGFLFGSVRDVIDPTRLGATVLGTALVVASGCVFNNCIDRDIDRRMVRTCHRALAIRAFPVMLALIYAAALGLGGLSLLLNFAGALASGLAVVGWMVYVGFYSLWLKRRSNWGIVIGSLSGAMPPAIGYCAARGLFDGNVVLLILAYCLWQMAHSHAIALFRKDDVRAACLPALAPEVATTQIGVYVLVFLGCTLGLGLNAQMGPAYFLIWAVFGGYWMWAAASGWQSAGRASWARKVFRISIMMIMALNVGLSLGS